MVLIEDFKQYGIGYKTGIFCSFLQKIHSTASLWLLVITDPK
jgi:hypothetical protein